ncbi:hypothetical protein LCGC14_1821930 [marine sediment metagenome]|uniref:Uncharacterized protein n=1 Tax=marine sediment metagenome TaxID=412755 RepID=A0A0F9GIM9_9ZZZZ
MFKLSQISAIKSRPLFTLAIALALVLGGWGSSSGASFDIFGDEVSLSGEQIITGKKTFEGDLTLKGLLDIDDGDGNIGIGTTACDSITAGSGLRNICIGSAAGTALTTGDDSIIIGVDAGKALTTQIDNVLIGYKAGEDLTDSSNVIIGKEAATNATDATQNVIIGGIAATNGILVGDKNVFIGYQVAGSATSATDNVIIGVNAATVNTFTGANNVVVGQDAARTLTSANQNTLVGSDAGKILTSGDDNVFLGFAACATLTTESDQLCIDNTNTTTPLIQGNFSTDSLTANAFEFLVPSGTAVMHAANITDNWTTQAGGTTSSEIDRGASDTDITYIALRNADGTLVYIYPNPSGEGVHASTAKP